MAMMQTTIIMIGLIAFLFWLSQLRQVVKMHDSDFPDRNDKLMWFLLVFFGSILGALLFMIWRIERDNVKVRETEKKLEDDFHEIINKKA
jgi:heme/copper-type cytochrome/quinol oxidase subunit 2